MNKVMSKNNWLDLTLILSVLVIVTVVTVVLGALAGIRIDPVFPWISAGVIIIAIRLRRNR